MYGYALLAGSAVVAAGCASLRHEAPPEVVPQPPEVTTSEVIEQHAADTAAAQAEAAARAARPREVARRYRPTDRSVDEIRSSSAGMPPPLDFRQRLDHAHDRIYLWMQERVQGMDHALASKHRSLEPVPAAPFRVSLVGEGIDRDGTVDPGLDADFDIALSLPNIERRLRIFVTSSELDESTGRELENRDLSAGFRYQVWRHLNFDLGVRIDSRPVVFTALKWTREIDLGRWDFYPFAKVFAETRQSVGYAAAVTFDRWAGRHLFRISTYAKWRADRDDTEWSETLVYARAHQLIVPDRYGSYLAASDIGRGWGLRLLASGPNARTVDRYETSIFYRRPTRTRWLYWSVEPLVTWERQYDWRADLGLRIGLEALFWDLARADRP
jgi:hypothetical protein